MAPKKQAKVNASSKVNHLKENQKVAAEQTAKKRRANSTSFKPNNKANPTGKNGHTTGLQPYSKRVAHYLEKYSALELVKMASDDKELDKLTSWDAIVVGNIAASIRGDDTRQEREALLNRLEGKPKERIELRSIKSLSDLTDEELAAIVEEDKLRKGQ